MRLAIEKKELIRYIQNLTGIVSSKTTSPILTNYLIEVDAKKSEVKITASDLEITADVRFNAAVSEGGTIAVSAKNFNDIISSMPDAVIDLWKTEDLLMIQCNKIDFNILCADHTLFPILPEPDMEKATLVNSEIFNNMISKTAFAVSTDINRAVLTGVCWKIMEKTNLMAATDGRKVAEIIVPNSSEIKAEARESGDETSIFQDAYADQILEKVIPVKTLNFLQKIYDPSVKEMKVLMDRNKIVFSYGSFTVISNVIEHKYPEYQKAFMSDLPNQLTVNTEILRSAIRRVSLVAPDDNYRIRFELDSDHFEISTNNSDTGDAKESIETFEYKGSSTSISFNFRYMLSILDAIDTEKVCIKLGGSKEPMMIYNEPPQEDKKITFLLMPLRS
ncbi:MAG TPA: DNA polymerase III subunit beta [Candidatus Cloacimonadota bacterium]|jgi:DNA polymerase-3 subunit beta|nr:DNA polymerase III subunit beta [Candidatus Cloacimonadota bacterium]HOF59496.1 DNA polymerase III subunit beta [Candidatus Cloacimonadota bacterium]HOR58646.1 DNA polymerase III subunit beta [Candidatus Cloacimonadota bacterium]HQL13285.1 DNA polymerase III subunit beta [Candidatus Cloacimonadota bacterium]HQO44613.1 DNA polymerase III subunit beta [Candidatus Cloacimonadota bacterium]